MNQEPNHNSLSREELLRASLKCLSEFSGDTNFTFAPSDWILQVCFHQAYFALALSHWPKLNKCASFIDLQKNHFMMLLCKANFFFPEFTKKKWSCMMFFQRDWTGPSEHATLQKLGSKKTKKQQQILCLQQKLYKRPDCPKWFAVSPFVLRLCQFRQTFSWSDTFYSGISRWHNDPPEMTSLWQPTLKASRHLVQFDSIVAATIDLLGLTLHY